LISIKDGEKRKVGIELESSNKKNNFVISDAEFKVERMDEKTPVSIDERQIFIIQPTKTSPAEVYIILDWNELLPDIYSFLFSVSIFDEIYTGKVTVEIEI